MSKNLVHPPYAGNGNFVCLVSPTCATAKRAYFFDADRVTAFSVIVPANTGICLCGAGVLK